MSDPQDTHAKALSLNLDGTIYGTFAEIGAGQEVARWFLRVGAASGTVAQTISAYDKTFSDDTYGAGTRYVSRERLLAMLDHEYKLLIARLGPTRGKDTRFFSFADTVATRNYKGDNEQHGWVGIRFQAQLGQAPSDILLHVNLMDPTAQQQQEALGVLGVNLVYAAFHQSESADAFLAGLFDELSIDHIEIDVFELSGPKFERVDARLWCLQALRRSMAHAFVFDAAERVAEPSGVLRKRPLIVERGRFETAAPFQAEMLRAAAAQLRAEAAELDRDPAAVPEISIRHASGAAPPDDAEILARVGRVAHAGSAIVSDFPLYYLLVQYLRRYTAEPLRFVVGISTIAQLLHETSYSQLPGTLLESLGRLLAANVKIYVSPMPAEIFHRTLGNAFEGQAPTSGTVSLDSFEPPVPIDHLYHYLRAAGWLLPLKTPD